MCELTAYHTVNTWIDVCVVGIRYVGLRSILKMSSRRLHCDSALRRKVIMCAQKHGNRAVGHTFDTHEANTRHWRNDWNSIVSYKATTKYFMGPKKGWYLQVDETVLVCAGEVHAKGLPATCCAMQLKAGEIAKTLGIHNKIQSNKRLVWLVHAGSRTVVQTSNMASSSASHWQQTEDSCGSLRSALSLVVLRQEKWFQRVGLRIRSYSYNLTSLFHTFLMYTQNGHDKNLFNFKSTANNQYKISIFERWGIMS